MKEKFVNTVKKYYKGFIDAFRGIFTHIPITFCVIVLFNIFAHIMAYLSEHKKTGEYIVFDSFVKYVILFSIFWALGTFLTEIASGRRGGNETPEEEPEITASGNKTVSRIIFKISGITASALAAFFVAYKLLGYFLVTSQEVFDLIDNDVSDRVISCVAGYVIILLCVSLYLCINKSKKSFFEYAMSIFVKYFQIYIVSIVTIIGSALITGIIYTLFFSSSGSTIWEIYAHICMLIGGMYALPFAVYALILPECEISRFMEILVKYVMHIISLIAYVIIYIYMIKILMLREIPSNSIFEICTALFVCSMIIAIMCLSFEVKGFLQKAAALLPYVFIPFIILQVYSVFARIKQYGVTPSRYVGVVFIVFEILYIVMYTVCKIHNMSACENSDEKNINASNINMQLIFIIIAVLTVISTFIPGINVLTLSKNSQTKIINKYISKKDLPPPDELIKKAYGAALYIKASDYGEELLYKLISKNEFDELKDKRDNLLNIESINKEGRIYGSMSINDADISGYSRIYSVSDYNNRWYDEDGLIDLKNLIVTTEAGDKSPICYNLDMSTQFEKYKAVALENEGTVFPYCDNTISLSDDALLYITYLSIRYNEDNENTIINALSFNGYIFAR